MRFKLFTIEKKRQSQKKNQSNIFDLLRVLKSLFNSQLSLFYYLALGIFSKSELNKHEIIQKQMILLCILIALLSDFRRQIKIALFKERIKEGK